MEASERQGQRARAHVVVAAALALGLALPSACLPDLAPLGADVLDAAAGARSRGCGDGVIATLDDGGDAGESCDPGDASVKGCSPTCQLECSEGKLDPRTGHCYFVAGAHGDIASALGACRAAGAGAHLVTVGSDEESSFVDSLGDRAGGYWVGMFHGTELLAYGSAEPDEPGFPTPPFTGPCPGCYARDVDGGLFAASSAFDAGPSFPCIVAFTEGWRLVPATTEPRLFQTICEREPAGRRIDNCQGGFCFTLPSTAGRKVYILSVASATADEARATCVNVFGAELVMFDSRAEREELAHEIRQLFAPEPELSYWIGVAADRGSWVWEDGQPVSGGSRPEPWGDRQPAMGKRAYMRIASSAYDTQLAHVAREGETRPTLCQRPVR